MQYTHETYHFSFHFHWLMLIFNVGICGLLALRKFEKLILTSFLWSKNTHQNASWKTKTMVAWCVMKTNRITSLLLVTMLLRPSCNEGHAFIGTNYSLHWREHINVLFYELSRCIVVVAFHGHSERDIKECTCNKNFHRSSCFVGCNGKIGFKIPTFYHCTLKTDLVCYLYNLFAGIIVVIFCILHKTMKLNKKPNILVLFFSCFEVSNSDKKLEIIAVKLKSR